MDYLTEHKNIVHYHARRFSWACGGCIDIDDLVQAGNIGLMEAAKRFDPTRGMKFSSYATMWIRNKIKHEVEVQSRTIDLPRSYRRKMWKRGERVNPHGTSLDTGYEQQRSPVDAMACEADPESSKDDQELSDRVRQFIIERFKERDRDIIMAVYFHATKPATVAREVGLSRERVRQICADGVRVMKEHFA